MTDYLRRDTVSGVAIVAIHSYKADAREYTVIPVDCSYVHVHGDRMSIGHDPAYWIKPTEWEQTTQEEYEDLKDRVLLLAKLIGKEDDE